MCVYMYIYIYVCVYMSVCVYVCMCVLGKVILILLGPVSHLSLLLT